MTGPNGPKMEQAPDGSWHVFDCNIFIIMGPKCDVQECSAWRQHFGLSAPPCISCGKLLEGPSYTGDCASACDEDCYEAAWEKQPVREEAVE